jgi:hypothetical protein
MPRAPRPVAPVVEPEAIADAVFEAVRKPAREYWIGLSTVKVILGNMVVPSFLDRYLAKVCIGGQQTDDPIGPDRADNLYEPVHSLHRTRGSFSAESGTTAPISPGTLDRWGPYLVTLLAGTVLGLLLVRAWPGGSPRAARAERRRTGRYEAR